MTSGCRTQESCGASRARRRLDDLPVLYGWPPRKRRGRRRCRRRADAELKSLHAPTSGGRRGAHLLSGNTTSVSAGHHRSAPGGVDAANLGRDALMRMYIHWAEAHKIPRRGVRLTSYAEKPASKRHVKPCTHRSPTARCRTDRTPTGWCGSARSGLAKNRRQTSFAEVSAAVVETADHIDIPEAMSRRRLSLQRARRAIGERL